MPDAMTPEQCRAAQRECSTRVHEDISATRREMKEDIAAIREAVQAIDRSVAQIKGHLGLNGTPAQRPHHRDSEAEEHLHKRATDALEAAEAAARAAHDAVEQMRTRSGDGIMLPRWAVIASAAVLLLIVILAAVAGERSIPLIFSGMDKAKAVAP